MPEYMRKQEPDIYREYTTTKQEQNKNVKMDMTHRFTNVKVMNDHLAIAVQNKQYSDMRRY